MLVERQELDVEDVELVVGEVFNHRNILVLVNLIILTLLNCNKSLKRHACMREELRKGEHMNNGLRKRSLIEMRRHLNTKRAISHHCAYLTEGI